MAEEQGTAASAATSYTWTHVNAMAGTYALGTGLNGAEILIADEQGYLNQPETHTSMGVGLTGLAGNLPTRPVGYLIIKIGPDQFKVPYYNM